MFSCCMPSYKQSDLYTEFSNENGIKKKKRLTRTK